jgi:hypothetical protein
VTSRRFLVSAPKRPLTAVRFCSAIRESVSGHCSRRGGRLPVGRIMLGFGHRPDVFGGIAQRQELAPAWHHDGVNEPFEPNH